MEDAGGEREDDDGEEEDELGAEQDLAERGGGRRRRLTLLATGKGTRGEGRGKEDVTDKLTPRDSRGKGEMEKSSCWITSPKLEKEFLYMVRKRIGENQTIVVALNSSRKSNFSCSVCGP